MPGLRLNLHPGPRANSPASTTDSALGSPTTPGPSLHAGLTADVRVLAVVIVPYDRLGHGTPHGRPGLGPRVAAQVHPVRRDPGPASRTPRRTDPVPLGRNPNQSAEHCGDSAQALVRPSQVRATGSRGVGAAGLATRGGC